MDVLTDVLAATKVGGAVTAQLTAFAPWGVRLDDMPKAAFHAVAYGTCWLRAPDGTPIQMGAGDFILLPSGAGHRLSSGPDTAVIPFEEVEVSVGTRHLQIPGSGAETRLICGAYRYETKPAHPLMRLLPQVVHLPADHTAAGRELADTLQLLATELAVERPGGQTVTERLVDVLLVQALRLWTARNPESGASWLAALRDPEIASTISLLHESPSHPWTIEELAARVGVSRATLARRFTALVGEPPLAYLSRWRMDLAARRLRHTSEPLPVIARSVGYTSEFAFSRAFKRTHGEPPATYRSTHRP
ncbi:AraC family transcriptional regulator [Nocardia sp. NPDC059240]|uniref:AraC family transcriptional regulator n=1 Tax=Nocardia sp. NPDC059240 TaxID=3346786 RepID=UPI0036B4B96C